jgi:hypothetical protein
MQKESLPERHRVSSGIVKTLSVVVLLLLILLARVFYGSMQDYETGETLLRENQTIRAITYFDRSLHWYAPLNPYVQKSAQRLWEIGEKAEKSGDTRLAVIAFGTIRSGFYSASYLVTPGKDWIRKVDGKLHELGAAGENVKDPQPNACWSIVVVIGFFGWVGSVLGFILHVMGPVKDFRKKWVSAIRWTGLFAVFFTLWIWGMFKA